MIPAVAGFSVELLGDDVFLTARPEGPAAGGIRYRERVRPLARIRDVLDARLAKMDLVGVVLGPVVPMVTLEGEYAALASATGRFAGAPVALTLGMVFLDDFHAELVSICHAEPLFARFAAATERLVLEDGHLLGARRRRYVYAPPAGWQPMPKLLHTIWLAPGYPRRAEQIVVVPAMPRDGGALEETAAAVLAAYGGGGPPRAEPYAVGGTWAGIRLTSGRSRVLGLDDGRYLYVLRADGEGSWAEADALARSIEPLPLAGGGGRRSAGTTMSHWAE